MKKMRGVIDPMTLGFLISILGGATVYAVHGDKEVESAASGQQAEAAEIAATGSADPENRD